MNQTSFFWKNFAQLIKTLNFLIIRLLLMKSEKIENSMKNYC